MSWLLKSHSLLLFISILAVRSVQGRKDLYEEYVHKVYGDLDERTGERRHYEQIPRTTEGRFAHLKLKDRKPHHGDPDELLHAFETHEKFRVNSTIHNHHTQQSEGDVIKRHVTDMSLTPEQYQFLFTNKTSCGNRTRRTATEKGIKPWPGGIIPYEIKYGQFKLKEEIAIEAAMRVWEAHSCVKFQKAKDITWKTTYLIITFSLVKCTADLGYPGNGLPAYLYMRNDCLKFENYLHYLGHVIGLIHEHNLPDRNRYINILWNNVAGQHEQDFIIYDRNVVLHYNNRYDLSSIMHFAHNAFSVDPKTQSTIVVPDRWMMPFIGKNPTRRSLSFSDVKLANEMYQCNRQCPYNSQYCSNHMGYVNEHCACYTHVEFYQTYCRNNPSFEDECYRLAEANLCDPSNPRHHRICSLACQFCPRFRPGVFVPPKSFFACRNLYTVPGKCRVWAARGSCDTSIFVRRYCRMSCGLCGDKTLPNCPNFFPDIECDRAKIRCKLNTPSTEIVKGQCQNTCGTCFYRTKGKCKNNEDDSWCDASIQQCDSNPRMMYSKCPSTCDRCWFNAGQCENKQSAEFCESNAVRNRCENDDYRNRMVKLCKKTCNRCYW